MMEMTSNDPSGTSEAGNTTSMIVDAEDQNDQDGNLHAKPTKICQVCSLSDAKYKCTRCELP
jgi:hypothetical protein